MHQEVLASLVTQEITHLNSASCLQLDDIGKFWSSVPGHPSRLRPPKIDEVGPVTLDQVPTSCALRRGTEVLDLSGRFRRYLYDETALILKYQSAALAEASCTFAIEARNRIDGILTQNGFRIHVPASRVLPLACGLAAEAMIDWGPSIHTLAGNSVGEIDELCVEIYRVLEVNGIRWAGMAPRNICINASTRTVHLLDWESAKFFQSNVSLTPYSSFEAYKIELDWRQLLSNESAFIRCISASSLTAIGDRPLDPHELAYLHFLQATESLARDEVHARCRFLLRQCCEISRFNSKHLNGQEVYWLIESAFPRGIVHILLVALANLPTDMRIKAIFYLSESVKLAFARAGLAENYSCPINKLRDLLIAPILLVASFAGAGHASASCFEANIDFIEPAKEDRKSRVSGRGGWRNVVAGHLLELEKLSVLELGKFLPNTRPYPKGLGWLNKLLMQPLAENTLC